jgi:DNA-damage-inducible protein J
METVNMSIRIDKTIKKEADELFNNLGLNMSSAINMFLKQSIREQDIPFQPTMIEKPNRKLRKALKEAQNIESGKIKSKRYNNFSEVLRDIDNDI